MSLTVFSNCSGAKLINKKNRSEKVELIEKAFNFHDDGYLYWETEICKRKHIFAKKICRWETTKIMPKDFGILKKMNFKAVSTSHWNVWPRD